MEQTMTKLLQGWLDKPERDTVKEIVEQVDLVQVEKEGAMGLLNAFLKRQDNEELLATFQGEPGFYEVAADSNPEDLDPGSLQEATDDEWDESLEGVNKHL